MVSDLLKHWAGHSERRTLFGETSAIVAEKTRAALDAGLRVILCVGETLAEREVGRTQQVVEEQLQAVVARLSPEDWRWVFDRLDSCQRGINLKCLTQPHRHRVRARLGNRHGESRYGRTSSGGARQHAQVSHLRCLSRSSGKHPHHLWWQCYCCQLQRT